MNDIFITLKNQSLVNNDHNLHRYIKFIEYCRTHPTTGYIEKHHIIPRSFGGNDEYSNIIKLSARQHYIAHYILAKATGHPKMIKALHKMVYSKNEYVQRNYKISSRMYEYVRIEHSKVVSNYSKNTVVAKQIYTEEITRIPQKLFHYYNEILYESLRKGKIDSIETKLKKQKASKRPRTVKQGTRVRSIAATLYSYHTPKGFCETGTDLFKLYPTFTKNTLLVINKNAIISKKFVSIHAEFADFVGKKFSDIGIIKLSRKQNESKN